jgi:DNA (cytosine-5)-methyltransferase 1
MHPYYDVPQNRERLILIGAQKSLPLPEYPAPLAKPAGVAKFGLITLPEGPSCQDALGDLPDPERFEVLMKRDWVEPQY